MNNKTRPVQRDQAMSHTAGVQMTQTSVATTAEPSVASLSRRDGKRKSLHTQPVVSQREMVTSNHSQQKIGKGAKSKGVRAKTNQKATNSVGLQPKEVGPSSKNGIFVFGSDTEQGPFCFSGSLNPIVTHKDNIIPTGKENTGSEHSSSCDGRQGELGDFLQGKGYFGGRLNHSVDKTRPNRGVGLVRNRVDGGMEEPISSNGEKQAAGLPAFEGRGVDHNAEPMVEIYDGSASNSESSNDKLRAISNKIRHAELGKISIGSRSDVDRDSDFRNEEIDQLPDRMLVDGQPSQGENDPAC